MMHDDHVFKFVLNTSMLSWDYSHKYRSWVYSRVIIIKVGKDP